MPDARLVVGAPLSLTGRYGFLGRLAPAGLRQVVQDARTIGGIRMGEERLAPELHVVDDGRTRAGVRGALEEVADAGLLAGPYGSDLVDEAARWAPEHGRVLWNQGASADEVERLPGVVSVPSPASRYLGPVLWARPSGRRAPRSPSTSDRGRRMRSGLSGPRSCRRSGPGPAASTTRQCRDTRPASSPCAAPRRRERGSVASGGRQGAQVHHVLRPVRPRG